MAAKAADQYFRAGVGMVVTNKDGLVLAFERSQGSNRWQLPQGGIEAGETPLDAAYRELAEETGIAREQVELVQEIPGWLAYELPEEHRSTKTGRGQTQKWFIFSLTDGSPEISLSGRPGAPAEFKDWAWRDMTDVAKDAVEFRQEVYQQIAKALASATRTG
jgi:putative (di)nucleoside polyphosphate hydrolase